jgi:hypothetical protein
MAIKFNRSQTFATNGTVTASGLHNLVDGLDIYQALITDQTNLTSVGTADELLIADADLTPNDAPRAVTVQELFNDALSVGTYTDAYLTGNFTTGTANITTGTIPSLTIGTTTATRGTVTTLNSTTGTITNLTAGTTTSTAANVTTGTVQTLTASTATITSGTYSGSINSTTGTIATLNSTTGTIGNLTTTLTGDVTISTGSATVGTRVAVVNTAQEYTSCHNFNATTLTSGTSIAWNLAENQVARLDLSTNGTMSDPSNKTDGATYILLVTQSTGTNTLAWNTNYKWPGGTAPTLTAGSGKTDIFTFVSNGTSLFGVASQNYS